MYSNQPHRGKLSLQRKLHGTMFVTIITNMLMCTKQSQYVRERLYNLTDMVYQLILNSLASHHVHYVIKQILSASGLLLAQNILQTTYIRPRHFHNPGRIEICQQWKLNGNIIVTDEKCLNPHFHQFSDVPKLYHVTNSYIPLITTT